MTIGVGDSECSIRRQELQLPISFMHIAVMLWAEWHEVVHIGSAVITPVGNVVRLTL
jgi:hypothetical protein